MSTSLHTTEHEILSPQIIMKDGTISQSWTNVRTDWLLNDDTVLDGSSDWYRRIRAKSERKNWQFRITPDYDTSYWLDVSQTATNFLKPFNLNTPNEFMKIEKISVEIG